MKICRIHPNLFRDERFAALSDCAAITYIRLLLLAGKDRQVKRRPIEMIAAMYPLATEDEVDTIMRRVKASIDELSDAGLVSLEHSAAITLMYADIHRSIAVHGKRYGLKDGARHQQDGARHQQDGARHQQDGARHQQIASKPTNSASCEPQQADAQKVAKASQVEPASTENDAAPKKKETFPHTPLKKEKEKESLSLSLSQSSEKAAESKPVPADPQPNSHDQAPNGSSPNTTKAENRSRMPSDAPETDGRCTDAPPTDKTRHIASSNDSNLRLPLTSAPLPATAFISDDPYAKTPASVIGRIAKLHQWYCETTGTKLNQMVYERLWYNWCAAGYTDEQLHEVVGAIMRGIKRGERNRGALKLGNLLDPVKFDGELITLHLRPHAVKTINGAPKVNGSHKPNGAPPKPATAQPANSQTNIPQESPPKTIGNDPELRSRCLEQWREMRERLFGGDGKPVESAPTQNTKPIMIQNLSPEEHLQRLRDQEAAIITRMNSDSISTTERQHCQLALNAVRKLIAAHESRHETVSV